MPRKKPDGSTRTPKPTPTIPLIARYLPIAIAELETLIGEGNETAARKLQLEIEEQLAFRFGGEALVTFKALVSWIGERAQNFTRLQMEANAAFMAAADTFGTEERGPIIEHE